MYVLLEQMFHLGTYVLLAHEYGTCIHVLSASSLLKCIFINSYFNTHSAGCILRISPTSDKPTFFLEYFLSSLFFSLFSFSNFLNKPVFTLLLISYENYFFVKKLNRLERPG